MTRSTDKLVSVKFQTFHLKLLDQELDLTVDIKNKYGSMVLFQDLFYHKKGALYSNMMRPFYFL